MYPLFKACTRPPMILGVPTKALIFASGIVMLLCVSFSFFFLLLLPIIIFVMGQITKHDDKQFNILFVWFKTKFRYPAQLKKIWGATSYSPQSDLIKKINK